MNNIEKTELSPEVEELMRKAKEYSDATGISECIALELFPPSIRGGFAAVKREILKEVRENSKSVTISVVDKLPEEGDPNIVYAINGTKKVKDWNGNESEVPVCTMYCWNQGWTVIDEIEAVFEEEQ